MIAIKDLSAGDLEIILHHLVRHEVERNQVLFAEGQPATSMYFLESGVLKAVSRKAIDGRDDVVLGVIKPGGYCGEIALLREDGLYENTIVAMEQSVILELDRNTMQKIMQSSMTAGTKLLLGISRNIREAIAMPQAQESARVVTFISAKDGRGRTTAATHLARYIAGTGKRVIYIDGDLQLGDASVHFGVNSQPHLARLVQMEERLVFDSIKRYFQTSGGVHLLASPAQPQEAEFVTRANLSQIIQECARNCDYLILDVPCHIDEIAILMWDVADLMVFVTEGNLSAMSRLKRLLATLERLNYPKEKFLGLFNKHTPERKEYLDNYRKMMPYKWLAVAEAGEAFLEAQLRGVPVWDVNPQCHAAKNMQAFCEQVVGRAPQNPEKGGIFSRLKAIFAG